ncbi:MAG: nucleotidyltransferase domain-containing protein [Thermodesulfobacteriota bacterium]|nr:nucleotidyltransferase domain-containing protein [Thermodesulfobacteriota bacterium]
MAASANPVNKIVKDYIRRLREDNIPIQKVFLFGSYATGNQRKDSDIDIAIISTFFKGDRFSDRRLIVPYRRGLDSRIDPIPFTPNDFDKGGILIDEIKRTGQIIQT